MSRTAHFILRLEMHGVPPELAVRYARTCEDILRDRAPAGVEILPLEFYGSRISPRSEAFSERVRAAMRRDDPHDRVKRHRIQLEQTAELARERHTGLEQAAGLVGEEIDPL